MPPSISHWIMINLCIDNNGYYMCIRKISIVRSLSILLLLVSSIRSYAYVIDYEELVGNMKGVRLNASEIISVYPPQPSSARGPEVGSISIHTNNMASNEWLTCKNLGPKYTYKEWFRFWNSHAHELSEAVNSCMLDYSASISFIKNIKDTKILIRPINVTGEPKGVVVALKYPPSRWGEPAHCKVYITSELDFGRLDISEQSQISTTGTINVECSFTTSVDISINRDNDLITADGAKIQFSSALVPMSEKNLFYDIKATMTKLPSQPGRYKWSVPITVQYN
ncbi:hypothetical protein RA808_003482 [Vibrio cholerae]|nr:hypothetical protein [Vibrio cholerae]